MKNRALFLALAAGGVFAGTAAASEDTPIRFGGVLPAATVNADGSITYGTPFQTNAIQTVWDNTATAFATGAATTLVNTVHVLDDYNFTPGPWSIAAATPVTGRAITNLEFGSASLGSAPATFDIVLRFWDEDDVAYTNVPSMIPTGAVPLFTLRFQYTNLNNGFVYLQPVTLTNPIPVPDGDASIFVEAGAYETGTDTLLNNVTQTGSVWATTNGTGPAIGSTLPNWGRDRNNDGIFTGAATFAGPPAEHNVTGSLTLPFAYPLEIRGDVPPPPPPATAQDLGCLVDGVTTQTLATDDLKWYKVCLSAAANDAGLRFLDIDSEGSGADVDIAVYTSDGAIAGQAGILGIDRADGSGNNAALSFGVGRRAPVGDGLDFDGRDGQLIAGDYYIAVAPAGSSFAPGFIVTPTASSGGAVTVNFSTNVNGGALATSVAPTVEGLFDFSALPWTFPAVDQSQGLTTFVMGTRDVKWSKFAISGAAEAASNTYLDLNFNNAESTTSADGVAYLFDATGGEVLFSDDAGGTGPGNLLPQMSFGATSPARTRGTNPVAFAGQDGDLPAGTYYVAMALFATEDLGGGANARWHVRGTSGSSIDVNVEYFTGTGIACDSIDFNNDGLFPDDNDLVQFLAVLAGGACDNDPNCNDIDFNNDGLFPDDSDLVSFLRVLAGGNCVE